MALVLAALIGSGVGALLVLGLKVAGWEWLP